jgi:hypothetical protein
MHSFKYHLDIDKKDSIDFNQFIAIKTVEKYQKDDSDDLLLDK